MCTECLPGLPRGPVWPARIDWPSRCASARHRRWERFFACIPPVIGGAWTAWAVLILVALFRHETEYLKPVLIASVPQMLFAVWLVSMNVTMKFRLRRHRRSRRLPPGEGEPTWVSDLGLHRAEKDELWRWSHFARYAIEHRDPAVFSLLLTRGHYRDMRIRRLLLIDLPLLLWGVSITGVAAAEGWQRVGPRADILAATLMCLVGVSFLLGLGAFGGVATWKRLRGYRPATPRRPIRLSLRIEDVPLDDLTLILHRNGIREESAVSP